MSHRFTWIRTLPSGAAFAAGGPKSAAELWWSPPGSGVVGRTSWLRRTFEFGYSSIAGVNKWGGCVRSVALSGPQVGEEINTFLEEMKGNGILDVSKTATSTEAIALLRNVEWSPRFIWGVGLRVDKRIEGTQQSYWPAIVLEVSVLKDGQPVTSESIQRYVPMDSETTPV